MSESFPLPAEPEGVIPSLLKRFNSGKIEAMMALYAPEAVFVANDGRTITDRAEFTAILEHDINLRLPLKANVRHVFWIESGYGHGVGCAWPLTMTLSVLGTGLNS